MEGEHPATSESYDESDWEKSREYIRREMSRMARAIDDLKEEVRRIRESIERREERVSDIIQSQALRTDATERLAQAERARQDVELAKIQSQMKSKAGIVGGLAGCIPAILVVVWELIKKG